MAKIAEIKSRPDRKTPGNIFVKHDHSLLKEIHREEALAKARERRRKELSDKKAAVDRRHNRRLAIGALLDSGMSRRQISVALGLSYGAVVNILWRWKRNVKSNT